MIDYQELKRLAEAATPGRVHDRLDSCGGGLKYECFGDDGSLVLKVDHKNDKWGFIGDRGAEDEAFFLACTPAAVLALVAEVEALRKDAERYRHIREHSYVEVRCQSPRENGWSLELLDFCVDDAMTKENK